MHCEDDWVPDFSSSTRLETHLSEWQPSADAAEPGETFFDAQEDEEDAMFVRSLRDSDGKAEETEAHPHTDAVLSCPGCFTQLCYSCQGHDLYPNQYRAISAYNCTVHTEQTYKEAVDEGGGGRKRRRTFVESQPPEAADGSSASIMCPSGEPIAMEGIGGDGDGESAVKVRFLPVSCNICNTVVAVQEEETQIFHFFHVLPGET
mmetsp:Transcript_27137/g.53311  ORF Transcript_27137/g.53311 Transcript_27137/m.53311 type:complete len:205 (+) Transcript_27137:263-877(+)